MPQRVLNQGGRFGVVDLGSSERPHTVDLSGQVCVGPRRGRTEWKGEGSPLGDPSRRPSLKVAETKEATMADYATLLRDHVTLTCRSVDRIFLQAYVPKLQSVGGVCQFLYWQKGFGIPSR